jgi:hypothetical protein
MISKALLNRLAAKKSGTYRSPFTRRPLWGGEPFNAGGGLARWAETPETWSTLIGTSHALLKLRHTGWYCDSLMRTTQFGVVRGLYTKDGTLFLACINDPHNGEADGSGPCAVEVRSDGTPCWYDTREEAARHADRMAEIVAERAREWDEQWTARVYAEDTERDALQQIDALRKKARSFIACVRQSSTVTPLLCAVLREKLHNVRKAAAEQWRTVRECRETMTRLKEFVS